MATGGVRKKTKAEYKRDAIRAADLVGVGIDRNKPANSNDVGLYELYELGTWTKDFDSYEAAYRYISKAYIDKQDFGTPYPWPTLESRKKNPAAKRAKNPATKLPAKSADVRGAARKYLDFTGHAPGVIGEVDIKIPKAVAVIGTCDGILYTTVRDGKTERYIHEFKAADRPAFTVTPDGRGIFLVGGRYDFTDRGIVDASDPTSPRRRRR